MKIHVLIVVGAVLLSLASSTTAQPLICPFTDYFAVSSPEEAVISSLTADGNVLAQMTDASHFTLSCKSLGSGSNGNAYLTTKINDNNLCTIHILDGPYEMNPSVTFINCVGSLKFMGMDHVWGTYTYTLKFAN